MQKESVGRPFLLEAAKGGAKEKSFGHLQRLARLLRLSLQMLVVMEESHGQREIEAQVQRGGPSPVSRGLPRTWGVWRWL